MTATLKMLTCAAVALTIGCGLRGGFPGFEEAGKVNTPPCDGNACSDVSITSKQGEGSTIRNNGRRTIIVSIRFMIGLSCADAVDITLGAGQTRTYLNGGYCNPYAAKYAAAGAPVPPSPPEGPRIRTFTITPTTAAAGATLTVRVMLAKPAPKGGTSVGFSSITTTGLTDTIFNMPYSFQFDEGARESTMLVRTRKVTPEPTRITFTAFTAINSQSVEVILN